MRCLWKTMALNSTNLPTTSKSGNLFSPITKLINIERCLGRAWDITPMEGRQWNKTMNIQKLITQQSSTKANSRKNRKGRRKNKAKEIQSKNKRRPRQNSDEQENMDEEENGETQNFEQLAKGKRIYTVEEIESKHMPNREKGFAGTKEITQEDLIKKESLNSINEFDIDGLGDNQIDLKETKSEGSVESIEQKPAMSLRSSAFTPKNANIKNGSNKSIDEFDIQDGNTEDSEAIKKRPSNFKNFRQNNQSNIAGSKNSGTNLKFIPGKTKHFVPQHRKNPSGSFSKPSGLSESNFSQNSKPFVPSNAQSMVSQSLPYAPEIQQPRYQQNWNNQYVYPQQNTFGLQNNDFQRRDTKKYSYYRLIPVVKMEDLFNFDTLLNPEANRQLEEKIIKKMEESRLNKVNPSLPNNKNFNTRVGFQQQTSYQPQGMRGRGSINKSYRGKPEGELIFPFSILNQTNLLTLIFILNLL